jgi:hypothetical protein
VVEEIEITGGSVVVVSKPAKGRGFFGRPFLAPKKPRPERQQQQTEPDKKKNPPAEAGLSEACTSDVSAGPKPWEFLTSRLISFLPRQLLLCGIVAIGPPGKPGGPLRGTRADRSPVCQLID